MRKGLVFIFLLSFLLILPRISFAGSGDTWKSCCSSGCNYSPSCSQISFSFGIFYCCDDGWSTSVCDCTSTTEPTTTTTTTTTTTPSCNNNRVCESGENQNNCPSDCNTVVIIEPVVSYPGQLVKVTVYFNDSRFDASKDAKVSLKIDNQNWDPSYCPINGKRWKNDMNYGSTEWSCTGGMCSKTYEGKSVAIKIVTGSGYIQAECIIPPNLSPGRHNLTALPVMYSIPITLRAGEAEIIIGDGLYSFVIMVKRFFFRLTGFFLLK
ncbi:MAG: hypothetical protein QXD95_08470 [Nitrososphaeria archaeon]